MVAKLNLDLTHLLELNQSLAELCSNSQTLTKIDDVVQILLDLVQQEKTLWVIGNGGSAAVSEHIQCDFSKGAGVGLKTIALTSNPIVTAYGNDDGYETIFAKQIAIYGQPGDVLLALSGSGNSKNIILGLDAARKKEIYSIGITRLGSNQLAEKADLCIQLGTGSIEVIEDLHLIIEHLITRNLRLRKDTHASSIT